MMMMMEIVEQQDQHDIQECVEDIIECVSQDLERQKQINEVGVVDSKMDDVVEDLYAKELADVKQKNDLFTSGAYSDPWTEYEDQVWKNIMQPSLWQEFKTWIKNFFCCFCCCCPFVERSEA